MSQFQEQLQTLNKEDLQALLTELYDNASESTQRFIRTRVSIKNARVLDELQSWIGRFPQTASPDPLDIQELAYLLDHVEAKSIDQQLLLHYLQSFIEWELSEQALAALKNCAEQIFELILTLDTQSYPSAEILKLLIDDDESRLITIANRFNSIATHQDIKLFWEREQSKIEIFKFRQDFARLAHYSELFSTIALAHGDFTLAEQACQLNSEELNEYQVLKLAQKAFQLSQYEKSLSYLKAPFPKLLVDKLELQEKIYRIQNDSKLLKENLLSQFKIQPDLKRYDKLLSSALVPKLELQEFALEKSLEDRTIQRSLKVLKKLNRIDLIVEKTVECHDDFELIFLDELHSLKDEFMAKEKLVSLTCLRAILVQSLKESSFSSLKKAQTYWSDLKTLSEEVTKFPANYLSHQNYRQELHYRFPEHRHFLI